jgi:hypothetical protein
VVIQECNFPQRSLLAMVGDESTKPWEAEYLTLGVVSLYQPVGVEQDALASISSTAFRSLLTTRASMRRRANAMFSSADILVPPCQLASFSNGSAMPPGGFRRIDLRLIHPSAWKDHF